MVWKFLKRGKRKYCLIPNDVLEKILQKFSGYKNFLDVGCREGELVLHLRKLGFNASGIDANTSGALVNLELPDWNGIIQGDIRSCEIEDYDVIFCNMSLSSIKEVDKQEEMRERQKVLQKLLRRSKKLILTQCVLLDGIGSYNNRTSLLVGIWQDELNELLDDSGAHYELLHEELDQNDVLQVVYELTTN